MKERFSSLIRNPTFQAVSISLVIALLIYGWHLFDRSVPNGGDVPPHIFKIELLYNSLLAGSWPDWIPWWYQGFPIFQYYPPGFYILGATLTFITTSAVISFKLLLLFTLMSNGLAAYYFSRRFLRFSPIVSILCLVAYQSSFFLLVAYRPGAAPNLLSWSICILFLTSYLCNLTEGTVHTAKAILVPGLLFGITLLLHPFPAIFAVLAVVVFHILQFAHSRTPQVIAKSQLPYLVLVFGIGGLLSITYWLPALLTWEYASPIYVRTNEVLGGNGMACLIFLIVSALAAGLITRWKTGSNVKLDWILASLILSSALAFGLAYQLPLIGPLLHEFRFATIVAPFFGVLLIAFPLDYLLKSERIRRYRRQFIVVGITCLAVIPVILPLSLGYKSLENELFTYRQSYLQSSYGELLESVQHCRLVVPSERGHQGFEADSPVAFGWHYDVGSITGGYNQEKPYFFQYTVHLEWGERWLGYEFTRENLMQEGGARYLFIRSPNEPFQNMQGLKLILDNDYGQIWELEQEVGEAASVSPILLDVSHPQQVTEFFNILVPRGYRMVFVDAKEITEEVQEKVDYVTETTEELKEEFNYVMVDEEARVSDYEGKTIFLLENVEGSEDMVSRDGDIITLSVPYLDYTNKFFYRGRVGSLEQWAFDRSPDSHLTQEAIDTLESLGVKLEPILGELKYKSDSYEFRGDEIRAHYEPGFILIKDSYFPYWDIEDGLVLPTTQGFMLTYSDNSSVLLRYQKPTVNTVASIISLLCFIGILGIVAIEAATKGRRNTRDLGTTTDNENN